MPEGYINPLDMAYETFKKDPVKGRNQFLSAAKPFIESRAAIYKEAPVPQPAVVGFGQTLALQALDSYKPQKAGLRTHLENNLRGMSRFVNQNKNVARIPEHRALKVSAYKNAVQRLGVELGYKPSQMEIADELSWPLRDVQQMEISLRGAVAESESFESSQKVFHDRFNERLEFARFVMSPQDQKIVDYLYGLHGKPQLSVAATANKVGVSPSKVYAIRQKMSGVV